MQAFRKMHSTVLEDAVCFVRKDKVSYAVHEKDIVMLSSRHKKLYIIKTDDELEIPNLSLNHFLKQIRTQKFFDSNQRNCGELRLFGVCGSREPLCETARTGRTHRNWNKNEETIFR